MFGPYVVHFVRFVAPPEDNGPSPALKVEIDPTASYMVLSDINRKVILPHFLVCYHVTQ